MEPGNIDFLKGKFDALKNAANIFMDNKDYSNALKNYNQALEIAPNDVEIISGKVRGLLGLGDLQISSNDFELAVFC